MIGLYPQEKSFLFLIKLNFFMLVSGAQNNMMFRHLHPSQGDNRPPSRLPLYKGSAVTKRNLRGQSSSQRASHPAGFLTTPVQVEN